MDKTYRYRIYPNECQKILIAKTFGCCRYVYNYFLRRRIDTYDKDKSILGFSACCRELTQLKKEYEWLREPDKCALQNTLKDLDDAYQRFFKGMCGFPNFKKKSNRNSFKTQAGRPTSIMVENRHVKLPKLGWIKTKEDRIPSGRIVNAVVTQVPSGKYYVSIFCTDVEIESFPLTGWNIGIDLGIKDFAVTSDGVKYQNHQYLNKSLNKLTKLQRELSRKRKGGKNREKSRIKLAKCYEKIKNQKTDYLQKLSHDLVKENDVICIESLNVGEMSANATTSELRRKIQDVSWFSFTKELEHKANMYGKHVIKVDKYFPSSQICHCCGEIFPITKNVSIREWKCPNCGTILDRDINAAINILNEGMKTLS